jgi:hypothetical protein
VVHSHLVLHWWWGCFGGGPPVRGNGGRARGVGGTSEQFPSGAPETSPQNGVVSNPSPSLQHTPCHRAPPAQPECSFACLAGCPRRSRLVPRTKSFRSFCYPGGHHFAYLPPGVSSSLHRRGDTHAFFLTFSSHEEALTFATRKVTDLRAVGARCRDSHLHPVGTYAGTTKASARGAATHHPQPALSAPLESSQDLGTWPAAPREQSCPLVSPQPARVSEGVSRSSLPLRATLPNRDRRVPPRAQAWSQQGCHSQGACRGGAQGVRHARS